MTFVAVKPYAWIADVLRHKIAKVAQGGWDRKERLGPDRYLEGTQLVLIYRIS
jgi:hypothetical protein